MSVRKTVIKLVLLCDERARPSEWTLESIASEMDTGDLLGKWNVESEALVPPAEVKAECEALGNDGLFFEDNDDDVFDGFD